MWPQVQEQDYAEDSARSQRDLEMNNAAALAITTATLQRQIAEVKTQLRDVQEMLVRELDKMIHPIKLQMAEQAAEIQQMKSKLYGQSLSPSMPTLRTDQAEAKSLTSMQHEDEANDVHLIDLRDRLAKLESLFTKQLEPKEEPEYQSPENERHPMDDSYAYLGLEPVGNEPRKAQLQWIEKWLEEVENGELDVYTCLGLSDCFSWTPDTRNIFIKAVAVTLLQMAVPFYLLLNENPTEIEWGPAHGNLGFRLVGMCLYGYAIYNMYTGADGHCRTDLVNLMFQYNGVRVGYWLPLVVGEISNVFTAIVLMLALYSIFTTQTQPADLIMNAIAVNFLCDCDSNFVDTDMKIEAVDNFKDLTHRLFTTQRPRTPHPFARTAITKINLYSLYVISLGGILGCSCFLIYPAHLGGHRDIQPGFGRDVVNFPVINNTLAPAGK